MVSSSPLHLLSLSLSFLILLSSHMVCLFPKVLRQTEFKTLSVVHLHLRHLLSYFRSRSDVVESSPQYDPFAFGCKGTHWLYLGFRLTREHLESFLHMTLRNGGCAFDTGMIKHQVLTSHSVTNNVKSPPGAHSCAECCT